MEKEAVCVTGANGFIGSWLIRTLLDDGYTTIHASIYPGSDASHLSSLPGAAARLTIHQADVLDADAVCKAVEGCKGVFHVASPCTLEDPKDPQTELLLPAIQGTLNVLEAARKANVRRIVLTSSISAIVPNPNWDNNKPFDESSWTGLDYCKARQKWYPVSMTVAEKAAWEYAEKHGMDMVVINPATCLGALMQPSLNASCAVLLQLLQGSKDSQEYHWLGAVHVRDVAKAQVLLFESPAASGRHLCTNGIYQFADFARKVSNLFPEFPVHKFSGETQPGLIACEAAAKKMRCGRQWRASKEELTRYMTYEVGGECPLDDVFAQKLMLKGCQPLPRRRCRPKSPVSYVEPALPDSLSATPLDTNVVWDPYTCKSYKDCFNLKKGSLNKRMQLDRGLDYGIDEVLASRTIRIGLDIIGDDDDGTGGTIAARMWERNVTVVTTSMNPYAPFSGMIASRGLLAMEHTSVLSERLPFFENTLDIVHYSRMNGLSSSNQIEYGMYDIYRVLRPGGLFWVDHFLCSGWQLNETYVPMMIDRIGFKRLRWNVGGGGGESHKHELYLSALLEKPTSTTT